MKTAMYPELVSHGDTPVPATWNLPKFYWKGNTFSKILPCKRLLNSTTIYEVVTRGSYFAVCLETSVFTVIPGDAAAIDITEEHTTVKLRKGSTTKVALIDIADLPKIRGISWNLACSGIGDDYVSGRVSNLWTPIHRLIMNCPTGQVVDHRNGDTLDNRRSNLRICSQAENISNRTKLNSNNTSGYKGIRLRKDTNKWTAEIMKDRKKIAIGSFKTLPDAILAYNSAAVKYHGEFAVLHQLPEIGSTQELKL